MLYPVELRNRILVIPERFELSTPGLKDRCSNPLSYEIVLACESSMINSLCLSIFNFAIHIFVISEGLEPSTFGVVNRRSIQLSYEILYWVSPGIEPCSPVPQTGALPNKLKKP